MAVGIAVVVIATCTPNKVQCGSDNFVSFQVPDKWLHDVLSTSNSCDCTSMTSKFYYQHIAKVSQSNDKYP